MNIIEKISEDLKQAMKNKDEVKVSALRLMRAEIVRKQKDKPGGKITEEDVIAVLQSMVRRHHESIEQFQSGGREDLVAQERAQLQIIESYLPAKLSEVEINTIIAEVIKEVGALSSRDFGKVMGKVMPRLKETGKLVDGKQVNELVRTALSALEKNE
ncbi:MAG: GatB/YqeY domain-containing protein [Candidatus Sumerlaeia bacterium]|nr:GatB/YqeY domain-containing protein [Candidatus Sumerlaeia bacterium]